jgi:hypothetical protein
MADQARRRELQAQYKQTPPEAGVYRIVNQQTQQALVSSSPNLPSVRSKLEFAQSTHTTGALDHRLWADMKKLGAEAFTFEVLELLEVKPEMTTTEIRDDLKIMEALWREKYDPALLY